MAFTREFIRNAAKESGVEIPKELEDALVQEHISARDAFAEGKVKAAIEENESTPNVKDSQEYKDLKKAFDDYKAEQESKETAAKKQSAYRALLKEAGVSEKRIDAVLRVSKLDDVELEDDGKIKGADKLTESIKSEWADFIVTDTKEGVKTPTPPTNNGGQTVTKASIMAIKDGVERRKAIAANPGLFGLTTNNE